MSHPTRLHAMRVIGERVATPAEIAAEIGEPVNNVAYHVKVLTELGCIELVKVEEARGGRVKEHFYRATQQPYFDDEAWAELGESEKLDVVSAIMQQISVDIADAMSNGTFLDPEDGHLSRTPILVDMDGWDEVNEILAEALEKLLAVKENVVARNTNGQQETFPVKVHMIHFRSPSGVRESI
ncbi:MAG TPA: helix-turn-helix domain-containing protein [Solirubrobacterales bacterium]|nr:helix-turn-helix domain-containing protein [Solirubrobacterales bacterium]